jgi:hypothetical protein
MSVRNQVHRPLIENQNTWVFNHVARGAECCRIRRPQQNDIRCFVHEAKRAQLANLPLVDGGLKSKVERIECLHVRQMRQLQPGLEITLPPCIRFRAHQLRAGNRRRRVPSSKRLPEAFPDVHQWRSSSMPPAWFAAVPVSSPASRRQTLISIQRTPFHYGSTLLHVDERFGLVACCRAEYLRDARCASPPDGFVPLARVWQ